MKLARAVQQSTQMVHSNAPLLLNSHSCCSAPISLGCHRCGIPIAPVAYVPGDRPARANYWERGNRRQYDGANNWTTQEYTENMRKLAQKGGGVRNDHIYRITNQTKTHPGKPYRKIVPSAPAPSANQRRDEVTQRRKSVLRNIIRQLPVQPSPTRLPDALEQLRVLLQANAVEVQAAGGSAGTGGGGMCEESPAKPDADAELAPKERYRGECRFCCGPHPVGDHGDHNGGAGAADAHDGGPATCFAPDALGGFCFGCCARRRGAA